MAEIVRENTETSYRFCDSKEDIKLIRVAKLGTWEFYFWPSANKYLHCNLDEGSGHERGMHHTYSLEEAVAGVAFTQLLREAQAAMPAEWHAKRAQAEAVMYAKERR